MMPLLGLSLWVACFLTTVESFYGAYHDSTQYDYNNGLAKGSVNKSKIIKRIIYGRCCFIVVICFRQFNSY